ncbi:MAG: P22 coat protein - protein 5 domain protein [Clostridia bacterium]|nr:P22 coat protein - protein 5 domain protein [Clostridia bacterium]MBQ5612426.1 P22 coat protein - protein 5 domain protein [Clostridia bacterium]MBQ5662180.1 P22 coat protein - protein 5 domain protein [Clostridia bacterium]MBQ5772862.1 P22 coat protein - protein 5 domain protein [Clostridia bacterium]
MSIQNFISTVWSENLYQALDKQYVAVSNCNRDYEGEIREKGNVVRICGIENVSVSDYTKNTNMSAPEALTDNYRDLVIDQAKYFNFQIDDVDRAQSTPKLMALAMKNAASALANAADRYVYGLFSEAGSSITDGNVTAETIVGHLIDARTKLFAKNVADASDIVIEVSPEIAGLILKAKVNLATDNQEALENGFLGSIGGCKIFVSNNISKGMTETGISHKCIARTKRAVAFAEQLSEIDAYRPELRFADAVKGLHLYGAKVVYPEEMVLLNLTVADEGGAA